MKWEYWTLTADDGDADLDAWGRDGWELVSVVRTATKWRFFFKRPLKER